MSRDPGSKWAPLPEAGAPDGYTKTQLIFHATGGAGSARSIRDNWFGRSDVAVESTFIVGKSPSDPTLQLMDSTDNADANYTANQRAISVEVVCTGSEPYTEWQVAECIRIGRWAAAHHPIARRICPSPSTSGFGWHVMFGAPGPWTTVAGKVCPGAPAIQQLKTRVFPAIFNDSQEDDMFSDADRKKLERLADLWGERQFDRYNASEGTEPVFAVTLLRLAERDARQSKAELKGLTAAFDKLADAFASQQGMDPAELKAAVRDAIKESVVTVDVNVAGSTPA